MTFYSTRHLLSFVAIALLLGGCESQINEPTQNNKIQFIQRPITYKSNSQTQKTSTRQSSSTTPRYYCLVSTLNPSGTEWAYRYRAYDLHIPKGLVKKAHKNGKADQWVTFQFASRNATHRTEADSLLSNGGIVRMARCKLPPSRKIHMKVKNQLIKFGKRSWAYQNQKPQATNTGDNISPVRTSITATCTAYWVYRLYDDGVLVYQEILGCSKWSYSGGGDDGGGSGGGSSGGNDSDPCSPNGSGGIPVIGCSDPKPPDCAGVPGGTAYKDACGVCVGGTTGRVACDTACKTSFSELNSAITNVDESNLNIVVNFVNEYGNQFGINSKYKLQHFMAQAAHESTSPVTGKRFGAFEENLNYSKNTLLTKRQFRNDFSDTDPNKLDPDDYAGHPRKMAEYLYGHAKDLGNTHDGDGYKYRGRGVLQLTGRSNYTRFSSYFDDHFNSTKDFVQNPGQIATDNKLAVMSGLWFFMDRVSDGIDSEASVKKVTLAVNGGTNGLIDRENLFEKLQQFITDCLK